MKTIVLIFSFFLSLNILHASEYESKLEKLDSYLKKGLINQSDYEDARKALDKLEEIRNKSKKAEKENLKNNKQDQKFVIRKFKKQTKHSKEFEKMEIIFSDYRIYTHRPGGIKIRRISTNKQLAVVGDNLKIKYYNNSENLISLEKVSDSKAVFEINNSPILTWDLKEVKKHHAKFYQVLALGFKPFHYYINLYNKNKTIALNYSDFDKKVNKAVDKAKVRLASTYNVSVEQINLLMKKREQKAIAELEKYVGNEKEKILEASLQDALQTELEAALGAALAEEFNTALEKEFGLALDQAVENELASAIDDAIAEAISLGISEAAISAGIAAALAVLAAGGTEEEAIAAGEAACGC